MMIKIRLVLIALLVVAPLLAGEPIKDSVVLDEQVVTGSRYVTNKSGVPFSVSSIQSEEIQQGGRYNVLTSLSSYVPGFFVTERNILGFGVAVGGSGGISIRGIGSTPNTQVLVLIDGHPQYQGIFGHPLGDAYVSSDVEKVEVIRGPASVLYGSNAMAGAVNILTKKAGKEGLTGEATVAYGSYNTQRYGLTTGFRRNKLHAFIAANHGRTDGIRDNTDFRISNGYAKVGYDISSRWSATADISLADYVANDNGPLHQPAPFHIDILRGKTALSVDNRYESSEGSIKLYHNFGRHDLSDGWQSNDRNTGLMAYQTFHLTDQSGLTAGIEAKQYGGTGNKGASANQLKLVSELAAYALYQQQFLRIFKATGGLRVEQHSLFGTEWVPMAGLSSRLSAHTDLRFSASKGFRSPTVMELYTYAPNPDLEPERMINYELSWLQSYDNYRFNTELTFFLSDGTNLIQVVGVGQAAQRQNVGAFRNKGIEFAARYRILPSLSLVGNYSYLHADRILLAAPQHQVNLTANYRYKMVNLNVSAQHVNGLTVAISPLEKESYTLVNARLSVQLHGSTELFVSTQNLLNQKYQINKGYPMPGINVHAGVKVSI
ncbi:MAG: TonB-dependent receptor [Paludibacter sp.]|nr:TonB-dependent receptor [Paludibacter sp.]